MRHRLTNTALDIRLSQVRSAVGILLHHLIATSSGVYLFDPVEGPMTEQPSIWQVIFTALVSGTVVSAMLGLIFHQRLKSIEARLNEELQRNVEIFRTTRAWQEAAISELLGPMVMQFDRVKRAFNRYKRKNIYLETKVIAEGNTSIKNLLLSRPLDPGAAVG
jgi:hypothetical protein